MNRYHHITPPEVEDEVGVLLARLEGVRPQGPNSWTARCPAHDDRDPSLSVSVKDGRVLVHCFAGCTPEAVLEAVGLTWRDLRAPGPWAWRPFSSRPRPKPEPEVPSPEDRARWESLWERARPGHPLLRRYLKARGLGLEPPPALRLAFLRGEPVMVARVEGPGGLLGLHLTTLEPDGRGRREKRVAKGSRPKGGAIRLFPLEAGQPLALAEEIETALAVREATGWPVWALVAAPFLKEASLPPEVKEVVVCADHDRAGLEAAHALARRLLREGRKVKLAVPPEEGEDWLDVLARVKSGTAPNRPKEERMLDSTKKHYINGVPANSTTDALEPLHNAPEVKLGDLGGEVPMTFQDFLKRVEGVKAETLPVLLPELFAGIYKGGLSDTEIESLFLTLKKKTGVSMGALRRDWTRYRATREEEDRKGAAPALTLEDRAAAQELSQDPALLHRAIRALGDLGVVGEEENRGLLYLALLSAKMADPISVLVKGRSSSGKSFLVKTVLTLIPPRGYYELSSMSTKALVYADLDFTHRHLVLYEEDGLNNEEVLYLVRTLLSEGEIRYLTVEKTPQGRMAAREIHRPGPTGLITTLTKGLTKEDNETRTFSLYMDDSKEHTLRVVHALAVRESVGARPEVEVAPWHALYEALPHVEVVVPFAPAIARLLDAKDLPEDLTRLRRDFGRFLTLVKVVALLHHARREEREGRIVATLEDYALAYHLAARPMARSVHTVSPQALTLAVAVREVYEDKLAKGDLPPEGVRVYVKELARRLRWATRTVQKWVDMADAAGLVEVQKDGNRLALRPVEGAPLEESSFRLLPEPERLARELGEGGRYVHPITGETCVLYLPESACALPSKTEENVVQDEENQRARYAHQRARTPEERAPEEEKPRAHSEVPSSSENSEVRARYAHAPTPATKEEVEVDL